jgi:hypothetical protein
MVSVQSNKKLKDAVSRKKFGHCGISDPKVILKKEVVKFSIKIELREKTTKRKNNCVAKTLTKKLLS